MRSRRLTWAAVLSTLTFGGLVNQACSPAADNPDHGNNEANVPVDHDAELANELLAAQDPNFQIRDHIDRYRYGQPDPVESEIYEKKTADGAVEKYVLLDMPKYDPYSYAPDQDAVKPVENVQVLQQVDGAKTDTLTDNNKSSYRPTSTVVRFYPYNGSNGYYSGYHSSSTPSYRGYYTDLNDGIHSVSEQQRFHQGNAQNFAKSTQGSVKGFAANARSMVAKVSSRALKTMRMNNVAKVSGIRSRTSPIARFGGTRGNLGRGGGFRAGG